jgi:endo-1,3-1,4-beta-glycanase ExoK
MLASEDANHARGGPLVLLFYDGLKSRAAASFAGAAYSRGRGAARYVYRSLKQTQVWTGFYTAFRPLRLALLKSGCAVRRCNFPLARRNPSYLSGLAGYQSVLSKATPLNPVIFGPGDCGSVSRMNAMIAVCSDDHANLRPNPTGSLRLFVVALALCLLAGIASAQDAGRTGTGGSFFDDFTTLDRNRWFVSNGWSNGDYQNCTWSVDNVRAAKHSLELLLTDQPSGERLFTCGELQTNKFYGYGTYEVRMRAAAAPGLVTAFFTYTGPPHGAGKPHDEVDFEFLGKDPKAVQLNYFADGQGKHLRVITFDFDAATTVNDYAFEWMPDSLRWFVNGRLVHEVKRRPDEPFPTNPGKIYLSIWNGKGRDTEAWLGRFEYPGLPVAATYEYVAFTEVGKECQFPTSIVCTRGTSRFRSLAD